MTALFSLSSALIMVFACGGLIIYARYTAERGASAVLTMAVDKLSRELGDDRESHDFSRSMNEALEELQPDNLSLFLISSDGSVLQSSRKVVPAQAPVDGKDWRTARVRVGENWLVIALPWTKTDTSLRALMEYQAILGLFVVLLVTVGAWMLVGRTLSPIGRLSHQANAATVENLRVRLEQPSQDAEIVGLVETLNGLLSRLSETASAKGRFYSAASHELRTPLQALSGHLELALNKDRSKEEYRSTVEEAYRQTRRLIKLTRGLLLLYQLDSSANTPSVEPVDLAAICRDILSQFQSLAEERGLRVRTDMPESAWFSAPATHAEVLVRNLVENAVRYACDGGEVSLLLKTLPDPDRVELRIFDECALSLEWDPDKLFEPFTRLDPSRNAATGGTGLGLAICKSIADANGWALTIRPEANGLLATLVVTLN